MTLQVGKLDQELGRVFSSPGSVASTTIAEQRWATAYHAYCLDAEDVSSDPPINLASLKFRSLLNFRGSFTAAQFAAQLEAAFVAYWTGTLFSILVPPLVTSACPSIGGTGLWSVEVTSVVVPVVPQAMYTAVFPILNTPSISWQAKSTQLAHAMHRVTTSAVTVLISGLDTTLPTPLPITNTCTVF